MKEKKAHHFNLSLAPDEKVELLRTSPISSRQKLKLLMVHMYENFTTFTCGPQSHHQMLVHYALNICNAMQSFHIKDYTIYASLLATGKNYMGAPSDFAPEMQKKKPSKFKKEPLKIAIDCNVKVCSMLQI